MKSIKISTLITVSLIFMLVGSTLYVSYKDFFYGKDDKLALTNTKPYLIEKLEYVDSFIIPDVTTTNDFDIFLDNQPTAAFFYLQDVTDTITQELNNSFNSDINHSLPLLAHWNSGDIGFNEGMTPDYIISLIEEGNHILPSWRLEPYWTTPLADEYYQASILRAKELNLPLTFIIDPLESAFIDDNYYLSLDSNTNPNTVDINSNIIPKISPFASNDLWSEVAIKHANNALLKRIQEWYPNPPLVMFVENKNVAKLSWNEVNISKRYIDRYVNNENDTFKRTLIGAQWIEKYRLLHENFKNTLTSDSWKANSKFIAYNSESLDIGNSDTWHNNSTITNHYFSAWPQTSDGVNIEYIKLDTKIESLNNIIFNINNLDFLLKEADKSNINYTHQLSISDNSTFNTNDEYRGFTQLALWLTRPNVIRELSDESNDKTILLPKYKAIIDSVELIHNNFTLQKFWKSGKLVENNNTKTIQNINVPLVYEKSAKWFLLDVDVNPVAPWTTNTTIPVYAIALETGIVPNREWLIYAQSPSGNLINVSIKIPGYDNEILINSSILGDFYLIKENTIDDIAIINIGTADTIESNITDIIPTSTLYIVPDDTQTIGQVYYVDATKGNDNNDGLTEETPWKSLQKVNNSIYNPNDHILFKSGEKWIGQLAIYKYSGTKDNPITYGAYGGEIPPIISTFYPKAMSWEEYAPNFWKTSISIPRTLRLSIDDIEILSAPLITELGTNVPDLVKWYQDSNSTIYLYSTTNPNNSIIDYNQEQNTLLIIADNITIKNIEFEGSTQGSIKVYNSSNIILDNIKAGKYSKSAVQVMDSTFITIKNSIFDAYFTFNYANADEYKESSARGTTDAIIFSRSNSDCIIENNYIKNWGHGSILIQADSGYEIKNLKINNNYITSPDITYGGRSAIFGNAHEIEFFNNNIIDISTQNQLGGYNNHIHHNIINGVRSSLLKENVDIGVGIAASGNNNLYENNVFANTDSECFKLMGADTYDNVFKNNILYNCGMTMNNISIGLRPNDGGWMPPDALTFQNNKFHNNIIYSNGAVNLVLHYTDGVMSLSKFQDSYSSMPTQDNYNIDPLFISKSDFHLQENSPAIGVGDISLSTFDKDNNLVAESLNIGVYITNY